MSEDWDSVTRIGSKVRGGGGGGLRETVVRGRSALNAAARSGAIIGTEKKYTTGNTASKPHVEGQHLTKVDRSDDIIPLQAVGDEVGKAIQRRRNEEGYKMTQKELAAKCNTTAAVIADLEQNKKGADKKVLPKIENVLNIKLTGRDIGKEKFPKKKK
ncbi:multiprotein-bridging factor 1 [Histoplasma capsulatum var. duboisii H88]|uniref:Multiprotein-bridging factor 1 n=2 Tax=Ajellomyces capsulatus TaxID=5037 RepID=F0UJF2_AJEC8|nr:multiprotein-bridging factor 1 [Histoplasma capsulatum H143]EGC45748.1 multiprotein-bridging factor 1 [Histoplasma capsulatum var. duboisii H88]QSS56396.1 multiprotein-bridging factor [Histoplasma capsulatum var. duboisii H88]